VLITDLHMPHAEQGFTVVTAMRHSQPAALTLLVSGYPDVQSAMAAILLEADEIIVKPLFGTRQNNMNHLDFSLLLLDGDDDRGLSGFSVDPIDGQLHEAPAQNGSVAGLLRFRALGDKPPTGSAVFVLPSLN
jgi:hypothetical protein